MYQLDFPAQAQELLDTITEIADVANQKLSESQNRCTDSFAFGNSMTGSAAFENLNNIQSKARDALKKLAQEPAIMRLVLEDEQDQLRVIYIARNSNLTLPSKTEFASYRSGIGRLAELPIGDDATVSMGYNGSKRYFVIEKTSLQPVIVEQLWDSSRTVYRHYNSNTQMVDSLRALLNSLDKSADELDFLFEPTDPEATTQLGVRHQALTALGLRDQPILDQFQGEIFRLPIDRQLIILGPPGTGKTTTLIKRLGQKLDEDYLDEDEKHIVAKASASAGAHATSWLMFTPSELLKHYLKEAFNREQVPASDSHIRTWSSYRNVIARNTLSILKSSNGGRFTLKTDLCMLSDEVLADSRQWFEAFGKYHQKRLLKQLSEGKDLFQAAFIDNESLTRQSLQKTLEKLSCKNLIDTYRSLDQLDETMKSVLAESKEVADKLIKKERNRLYNTNKGLFDQIYALLEQLKKDEDADDEESFDDDESETITDRHRMTDMQQAAKAYASAIKALSRTRYLKKQLLKKSRYGKIVAVLGDAIPDSAILLEIGRHISLQNALRRFIGCHKRYVNDVVVSYLNFRKDKKVLAQFYSYEKISRDHISETELDALVLLMLKNARQLIAEPFVKRSKDEPRFGYLLNISELFEHQVMVDEATDFSMLQLACMAHLTHPETKSFFACGDFNQRITQTGIRRTEQLAWAVPSIELKSVNTVYRQSQILNSFAQKLLELQGGDLSSAGEICGEIDHKGVEPVLHENAGTDVAYWIAERIKEVERAVQTLPTIAVLVNSEEHVRLMAEQLSEYLEEVNLSAVACEYGKALGEGTDVRVFDIQHIKGLEFEAVFFVGIDQLAKQMPELFDRYLYVGATRAATYLGLVCEQSLPEQLEPLRDEFVSDWCDQTF